MAIKSWETVTLKDVGVILIDCDHRTPPATEVGYPYVAIPQLKNGHISLSDARKISFENYKEWTRKAKPRHNDVVLSRRCNPGETAYVRKDIEFALGQNLVLLRATDSSKVAPEYLRWMTCGPKWWEQISKFINVGAIFDSLKCADILNFELPLPPLPEQRIIAHILGILDEKIELNRNMNQAIDALAKTLFKSWFVDFNPVRAKMDGCWKLGQPLLELPEKLYDVFPDQLIDSDFGKIPAGWKVRPLDEIANFF